MNTLNFVLNEFLYKCILFYGKRGNFMLVLQQTI